MGAFSALDLSNTGLDTTRVWLDTISHNLSNLNTVRPADEEPFRALLLQVQENTSSLTRAGGGVEVADVALERTQPQRPQLVALAPVRRLQRLRLDRILRHPDGREEVLQGSLASLLATGVGGGLPAGLTHGPP